VNERRRGRVVSAAALLTGAILTVGLTAPAMAQTAGGHDTGSEKLRKAVTASHIIEHLNALQSIADANGGTRSAGTPGHVASAEYIEKQLKRAGYETTRQPFSYDKVNLDRAEFSQTAPDPVDYTLEEQFYPMDYSGEGSVDAAAVPVDVNLSGDLASTSGCEAADFATFPAGSVALIQRGTCPFADKAANAQAAGASAVIIFNQGNDVPGDDRLGVLFGTLGAVGTTIPVLGTSFEIGSTLAVATDPSVHIIVETTLTTIDTFNVLASTKKGDPTKQVVVGAHLDSVPAGPGINDNGSGSATILEVALQLAKTKSVPANQIVFAWWSGEEDGLQGSNYYVSQLTDEQTANTALDLNFDMVASPNPVRFVYDGDGDAFGTAGPDGSAEIEAVFNDYFASQDLATAPTAFDGRSDYFGFINAGIPAGGLFTGAEGLKTAEEAAIFGGTADAPYDACYHQACDTAANIDKPVLEEMADAVAHSVYTFGSVTTKPGHGGHHGHGGNGHGHWGSGDGWGEWGWGNKDHGHGWGGK
jgi:Zn-dependent M28 family amino/carboxypeptidase